MRPGCLLLLDGLQQALEHPAPASGSGVADELGVVVGVGGSRGGGDAARVLRCSMRQDARHGLWCITLMRASHDTHRMDGSLSFLSITSAPPWHEVVVLTSCPIPMSPVMSFARRSGR